MIKKVLISILIITLICLSCLAYGYFIEPRRLVSNRHNLQIKNWNRTFDGFKIVAVSDIHGGSNGVTEEKLRELVRKINEQNADLVVLLGDYVSQGGNYEQGLRMPMATIAENLRGITAKYGVYAVLGNHDGWFDDAKIRRNLESNGIKVLESEVAVIEKDGQKLRILGLKDHLKMKDWKSFSAEAKSVLSATENQGDVIVLEHSPDILPAITDELLISKDLKLVLAGHTHGGQVWFPVLGSLVVPSSYGQKYAFGHIKDHNLDLFVTTGVGTSVLPFRFLVPPEIAVLEINSEQ
jgi:uncharacterized protein